MASARQALSAPGTTGMQLSRSKARFSRFWLVMYSSACQRVSQRLRLPTLTLPATAPMRGSAKWRTSLRERVGRDRGVGVNRHHNFAVRLAQRARQRRRFAVIGLVQDAHARIVAKVGVEQFAGAVRRTVIHHHHFELPDNRRRAPTAPCARSRLPRCRPESARSPAARNSGCSGGPARNFSISASTPMISARPLTRTMPITKIQAMPRRSHSNRVEDQRVRAPPARARGKSAAASPARASARSGPKPAPTEIPRRAARR